MDLTTEQLAVIKTDFDLVINAVAGSGKTTTLIEYAKSRPANTRILYLAFNKTVKAEAIQKFAAASLSNVKVETAHSLAYDHIIKGSNYKVIPGYKSYAWCDILDIKTNDRHTDLILAHHVNKFITCFCNSKASKVIELNYADTVTNPVAKTLVTNFYKQIEQYTRIALAKMDQAEISVTHDFYLKKFQLSNLLLPYDYILFDEGQDASPAMLDVFFKQAAIKIIVGDRHQQIYSWRFAINSLEQADFPVYHLSSSFRFDDEIALVANKILAWKNHLQQVPAVKINGAGNASDIIQSKATLGRTNLGLLLNAIAQWQHGSIKKLYFEGNINSYTFADEGTSLYDVLNLYNGKSGQIKDKLIAGMKDIGELENYIEKSEDNSLLMIVEVVKEFGNRLPRLIAELKRNHVATKEEADMIFTTVHRCKGMEYDEVILLNDFINEEKLKKYILQYGSEITQADKNRIAEEVNILYVAATRAKSKLNIPTDLNPLKSINVADMAVPQPPNNYKKIFSNDWESSGTRVNSAGSAGKKFNHGKKWSDEDEFFLEELFHRNIDITEIAKLLGRGKNAVRMKLVHLGFLDDDGSF